MNKQNPKIKLVHHPIPHHKYDKTSLTNCIQNISATHPEYEIPLRQTQIFDQKYIARDYNVYPYSANYLHSENSIQQKSKPKISFKLKKLMDQPRKHNEAKYNKKIDFSLKNIQTIKKNSKSLQKLPLNCNKILSQKVFKKPFLNLQKYRKTDTTSHMKANEGSFTNPQKVLKNVINQIQNKQDQSKKTNQSSKNSDSQTNAETNVVYSQNLIGKQIQNQSLKRFCSDLLRQNKLLKEQIKEQSMKATKNIELLNQQIKYLSQKLKGMNDKQNSHIYGYHENKADNYQIIPELDSKLECSDLKNHNQKVSNQNINDQNLNIKKYSFLQVESHVNMKKKNEKYQQQYQNIQIQQKANKKKVKLKKKQNYFEQILENINVSSISQLQLQSLASNSYFER